MCRERVAIVDPTPGITRDRIAREVTVNGRLLELVDTGGVGMESTEEILADVEMQIEIAITQADLVLLVVDAQEGLQPLDKDIARRLHRAEKQVLVVANKGESPRSEAGILEFFELGFGEPIRTAALHREGIGVLCDRIEQALPSEAQESLPTDEALRIAFVGQRNVGKSTLINQLARQPRVVVSELPGTTRDSVDVRFRVGELEFVAIDTAGVRRKKQLTEPVDYYSQVRTGESIERADVVVLMLEAPREITRLDRQLADQVTASYKPCVIALNKIDLVPAEADRDFPEYLWWEMPGLRYAPIVMMSALTGENTMPLLETVRTVHQEAGTRVKTAELNTVMQEVTSRRRPDSKGARPGNVLYSTQVGVRPPTVALFVNDSARVTEAYERYLANQLRQRLPFAHVPIRFAVRRRQRVTGGSEKTK
jgi:GTP-binding protein